MLLAATVNLDDAIPCSTDNTITARIVDVTWDEDEELDEDDMEDE
jgi:hypothetical protein